VWNKWAEISKENLKHNVELLKSAVPQMEPIAVVKDDAYGHDMALIVPELLKMGISKFAVVYTKDALMVTEMGAKWVLVLDDKPIAGMESDLAKRGIRFCITDPLWLDDGTLDLPLKFHLFVDVGMHREGIAWDDTATIKEVCSVVGDRLEGICSHLSASTPGSAIFRLQEERFREVLKKVPDHLMVHLSNSGSLVGSSLPYATHFRPGIALYGYGHPEVKPVLSLKTRVLHKHSIRTEEGVSYDWLWKADRNSQIATVPVGYGDGYSRRLSNRAIAGSAYGTLSQVGAVTMDFTMFRCPEELNVGDEVVLMGQWEYGHFWADDMAKLLSTIPYEILTGISHRIPRTLV
jgi:alanine racemase